MTIDSSGRCCIDWSGTRILLEDEVGREIELWGWRRNERSSSDNLQNTWKNIKTSKEAVPYWAYLEEKN